MPFLSWSIYPCLVWASIVFLCVTAARPSPPFWGSVEGPQFHAISLQPSLVVPNIWSVLTFPSNISNFYWHMASYEPQSVSMDSCTQLQTTSHCLSASVLICLLGISRMCNVSWCVLSLCVHVWIWTSAWHFDFGLIISTSLQHFELFWSAYHHLRHRCINSRCLDKWHQLLTATTHAVSHSCLSGIPFSCVFSSVFMCVLVKERLKTRGDVRDQPDRQQNQRRLQEHHHGGGDAAVHHGRRWRWSGENSPPPKRTLTPKPWSHPHPPPCIWMGDFYSCIL